MQRFLSSWRSTLRGPARVLAVLLAAAGTVGLWGCGSGGPTGKVSGKVVLGTEPLTEADVLLCRSDGGAIAKATLGPGGEFKFAQPVPVGQYQVQIESTVQEAPPVPGETREPPKPRFQAKYQSARTSGLIADVKAGDNSFTFTLE